LDTITTRVTPLVAASLLCLGLFALAMTSAQAAKHSYTIPPGAKITVHGSTAEMRGNGVSGTFKCSCNKAGSCTVQTVGKVILCNNTGTATCTGECQLSVSTTSLSGGAAMAPPDDGGKTSGGGGGGSKGPAGALNNAPARQ
jgi:hypothetical protein